MIVGAHLAALLGYGTGWALYLEPFRRGRSTPDRKAAAATAVALLLHVVGLVAFGVGERMLPLVGVGPASSTLALAIAGFTLAASLRPDSRPAGLFLLPLVVLLLLQSLLVGFEAAPRYLSLRGPWFVIHVATVFVGLAGLALASAAGTMYLLQFRALRRKEFGSVFRFFPSLEALDRLERVGLGLGFPALSVGLLAGWGWTLTFGSPLPADDPKVVLAVVAWGSYLLAILARLTPGWRGRRAAIVVAAAFFVTAAVFVLLRLRGGTAPGAFL